MQKYVFIISLMLIVCISLKERALSWNVEAQKEKRWSLYDHLQDKEVVAFSDEKFVWVNNWIGYFNEKRTGLFHPTLKDGYKNRKNHFGSIDKCNFPFTEMVEGKIMPDQVGIHPDSPNLPVYLNIHFDKLEYTFLIIDYALADNALRHSDGVLFKLIINTDSWKKIVLNKEVKINTWLNFHFDLNPFRFNSITFQLVTDGINSTSHDWFKIRFILIKP